MLASSRWSDRAPKENGTSASASRLAIAEVLAGRSGSYRSEIRSGTEAVLRASGKATWQVKGNSCSRTKAVDPLLDHAAEQHRYAEFRSRGVEARLARIIHGPSCA